MQKIMPFFIVISFLLSSCGALSPTEDATPTISAEDIRATADVMVYDMLTKTQAAMPTNTIVPPTNTLLPIATETFTSVPTLATIGTPLLAGVTPTAIGTMVIDTKVPSATPTSGVSCQDQLLSGWSGEGVPLYVTNNVKNSTANVFLCITTKANEVGYINVPVVNASSATVPMGCYFATAWVDGEKDFNASTYFCLDKTDPVRLMIDFNKLQLHASCAPNC